MKNEILNNIARPAQLEKMYRSDKRLFTRLFSEIYPEISHHPVAQAWYERLNYENAKTSWGSKNELAVVALIALLAGCVAKLPDWLGIQQDIYYQRNIGFIVFPFLSLFFAYKKNLRSEILLPSFLTFTVAALYINFLPAGNSDTFILACLHLPLLLWSVLGLVYTGKSFRDYQLRLDFLRYNGDLLVMMAVLMISCGILTGITIGLFELIGVSIEKFYFSYVVVFGLPAVPLAATYLVQNNPQLVSKVSPVVARIFTPLVLVMLVVYLFVVILTGKDPYNDREFLMIFNLLLIGVMALILFSVVEMNNNSSGKSALLLITCLAVVTILVNGVALSAILFRISEWGFTPNRMAVLGGNLLMISHLLTVTFRLFKSTQDPHGVQSVSRAIAAWLPVYIAWTILVIFLFPFLFGMN